MKKFMFLVMAAVLFTAVQSTGQNVGPKTKLLIYYFHITNRCQTCTKIEAVTQKTLADVYSKEIESGVIVFKSFNVDLPENSELVKKYEAYGATLAFTPIVNGKEAGIDDLTGMAFSKIGNESLFVNELKDKINLYIK
jgi:hypothetical protein